jgi:hypothetical protein
MDDQLRLLRLEWLVDAIAKKVGVDVDKVAADIRWIERRREEVRLAGLAMEEDETFRRSYRELAAEAARIERRARARLR